jgi:hypothetical protein
MHKREFERLAKALRSVHEGAGGFDYARFRTACGLED